MRRPPWPWPGSAGSTCQRSYTVATHSDMIQGIHCCVTFKEGRNLRETDSAATEVVERRLRERGYVTPPSGQLVTLLNNGRSWGRRASAPALPGQAAFDACFFNRATARVTWPCLSIQCWLLVSVYRARRDGMVSFKNWPRLFDVSPVVGVWPSHHVVIAMEPFSAPFSIARWV